MFFRKTKPLKPAAYWFLSAQLGSWCSRNRSRGHVGNRVRAWDGMRDVKRDCLNLLIIYR